MQFIFPLWIPLILASEVRSVFCGSNTHKMFVTPNRQDIYIPNLIHETQRRPCCSWCLNQALGTPWQGSSGSRPSAAAAAAASRAERGKVPAAAPHRQRRTPARSCRLCRLRRRLGGSIPRGQSGAARRSRSQPRCPGPSPGIPGSGDAARRSQPAAPERRALARTSLDGDRTFKTESESPEGLHKAAVQALAGP